MKYLYGDATPFPLNENFIDTIHAATDAAVALFKLDEELVQRQQQAELIRKKSEEEMTRLTRLSNTLEAALRPLMSDGKGLAEATAQKIAQHALSSIKQARAEVTRQRDSSLKATTGAAGGQRVLTALEKFMLRHELPKTEWQLNWGSGHESGEPELALAAMAPSQLNCGFRSEIPAMNRWTGPVRIEDIDPLLRIDIQGKINFLRGKSAAKRSLHRFYITRVAIDASQAWFELRQTPGRPSMGYEVSMRSSDQSEALIYPIDQDGDRAEALALSGADATSLKELWDTIERELSELIRHRTRMVWARLDEQDVKELKQPSVLGETLLLSIAPIIREIRLRSRVPGELVLKRDLGDGRREELFIPRKDIEQKYASLAIEHRQCFTAAGLGSEGTSEFVQRGPLPLQAHGPDDSPDDTFDAKPTIRADKPI